MSGTSFDYSMSTPGYMTADDGVPSSSDTLNVPNFEKRGALLSSQACAFSYESI